MPLTVRDIMTNSPVSVKPTLPVRELIERFDEDEVHGYPVVSPEGQLLGIVTKLDVLRVFRPGLQPEVDLNKVGDQTVHDIMRPGVLTLQPGDALAAAIDLMVETRLRSLPVVERRRGGAPVLVGMVSQGDVLRGVGGLAAARGAVPGAR
jgi:CBS domain-containing protein